MKWMFYFLSYRYKKKIVLYLLKDIVNSSSSSIDHKMAEDMSMFISKSSGNRITAFVVRD